MSEPAKESGSKLVCHGCGTELEPDVAHPFVCPERHADDVDHVLNRELDLDGVTFPREAAEGEENPFLRFRRMLHSYRFARACGDADRTWVRRVTERNGDVADVDGHGFAETPYGRNAGLSEAVGLAKGGLWVKNETGGVAGSHKARHLMGIAMQLDEAQRAGLVKAKPRLAIASCGNAALAAATLAKAFGYKLDAFVPADGDATVLAELKALGANVIACDQQPDAPPGDPCVHRFRAAVAEGAVPFSVQGSDNALAIEGGETLAWEIAAQHAAAGGAPLDRLVVQVGGGALASACFQGLRRARELGVLPAMPRIHAVQTEAVHPLDRAWRKLAQETVRLLERRGVPSPGEDAGDPDLAAFLAHEGAAAVQYALEIAPKQRSTYMRPWKEPVKSAADGILDVETYDWLMVVRAMIETGGWPLVVGEKTIEEARALGNDPGGVEVSATGAAGLAGVLALKATGELGSKENVGVIFTGVQR